MIGTYLIKAVRGNGIRSRQSTGITTNVAALNGLNVVEVLNETGFNGTLDRLEIVNGSLQLLSKNVIANWSTLADVISLADGTTEGGGKNVEVQGYYYFSESVDLGEAYTSRLTATLNAEGVDLTNVIANWSSLASVALLDNSQPEDWGVEVQYRSTNSDPSSDDLSLIHI